MSPNESSLPVAIPHQSGSGQDPVPFSVLCIDDNALLVDALERRLALEPGCMQFYNGVDIPNAVALAARVHPTVVLLDIDLPGGMDAMTMLKDLGTRAPDSRVVIFTGYPSGELMTRAMSGGAWGFVSKGVPATALIGAIHRVVAGEAVILIDDQG